MQGQMHAKLSAHSAKSYWSSLDPSPQSHATLIVFVILHTRCLLAMLWRPNLLLCFVVLDLMKTWMRPLMKEMYGLRAAACPSAMNRLSPFSTGDSFADLIWSDLTWSDQWLIAKTGSPLYTTNVHEHLLYPMLLHLLRYLLPVLLTVLLTYCVTHSLCHLACTWAKPQHDRNTSQSTWSHD